MEIYAPIAHRLGMQRMKWELEDLSLKYLDPTAFNEITHSLEEKSKEYGSFMERIQKQIEGKLTEGEKVVVIEDLISTGGSVLDTVAALREAGAEVLGVVSIFTYGMKKGVERMAEAKVKSVSLTNLDTIARVGAEEHYITEADVARLLAFRDDPADESWIKKGGTN